MATANRTRVVAPEKFVLFLVEGDEPESKPDPDAPEPVSVREFSRCHDAIHEARRHMRLHRHCARAEVWLGHSVMLWSSDLQDVTFYGGPVAPGRYWASVDFSSPEWPVTFTLRA